MLATFFFLCVACVAMAEGGVALHFLQSEQPAFSAVGGAMPSAQCRSLLQDRDGFVWVATTNGLARYDGIDVSSFGLAPDGAPRFDRSIMTMVEDTVEHCIWAVLENSQRMLRLDLRTFETSVLSYSIDEGGKAPLYKRVFFSIGVLTDTTLIGRTMLGYYTVNKRSGHVRKITDCLAGHNTPNTAFLGMAGRTLNVGNGRIYDIGSPGADGLPPVNPVSLRGELGGCVFIKDARQVSDSVLLISALYKSTHFNLLLYNVFTGETEVLGQCHSAPHGMCLADDGLWVATYRGLVFFRKADGRKFVYNTGNSTLHDNDLACIMKVRDQPIFFIGTSDGLVVLNYYASKFLHTDMRRFSPSRDSQVWSLAKDCRGGHWVGCTDGLFFKPADRVYFSKIELGDESDGKPRWVLGVVESSEGDCVVAVTSRSVYSVDLGGREARCVVSHWPGLFKSVQAMPGGRLLLVADHEVVMLDIHTGAVLRTFPASKGDNLRCGYTDDFKTMWLACRSGMLRRLNLATGQMADEGKVDGDNGGVSSLRHNTQNGVDELWIVTTRGGLLYKNPGRDGLARIDVSKQLDSVVRSVEVDNQGDVWVATDAGIVRIAGRAVQEFSAGKFDICHKFLPRSSGRGPGGEILFGGRCDFVEFWPGWFDSNVTFPAPKLSSYVLANSVSADYDILAGHDNLYGGGEITVPAGIRSVMFKFRSLNYDRPEDNRMEWRLDGETAWRSTEAGGNVLLSNLSEGRHTLMLRTLDDNGCPMAQISKFYIRKEVLFFETRIFAVIVALGIVALVVAFIVWKNHQSWKIRKKMSMEISTMSDMLLVANNEMRSNQSVIKRQNEELALANATLEKKVAERTQELEVAKLKAEESSQLKSTFLANLGHEVRTPMNAIVGFAKLLQAEDCPNEERTEFAHLILESSNSMLSLMGALLDTSRIERGVMEVSFADVDVYREIYDTWHILSVEKRNPNVKFELDIDESMKGLLLRTDKDRLRQIIINLTYNAFKFTSSGSVTISARKVDSRALATLLNAGGRAPAPDAPAGFLLACVEDTGIGIPKDKTEVIFEPFRRLTTNKAKYAGLGLGLNIVRNLTRLLGGDVWVRSELGCGSRFYFYLPFGLTKGNEHKEEHHGL